VVAAGLTVAVPEGGRDPTPGAMVTEVTLLTFQLRVEFPPGLMLGGLAVKESMTGSEAGGGEGGGEGGGDEVGGDQVGGDEVGGDEVGGDEVGGDGVVTAIVTDWETVPAALVAVRV
jgi:hypothetical protein